MKELRVEIGGSNRGFQIATDQTKQLAKDLNRSLEGYTPDTFKGAQMMRDAYGKRFDELKGSEGIGGLIEKISGGFGEAGAAVLELAQGPVGILTAAIGGVYEGSKMAWEAMRESFKLARDAQTLGFSTTGLKQVDRATEEQGFDDGEGRNRLGRFVNKVGEAAEGNKASLNIFKDLGIDIDGKTTEEVLKSVAEAFEKITSPAERAHKAVELFGKGGQDMIQILHQMAEGGTALERMGLGDEQTDAILGGAWKKIHGFFSQVMNGAKEAGKSLLADVIQGYTGYQGEGTKPTNKIKVESPEDKAKREQAAAEKSTKLAEAQSAYRREVEATSDAATKLAYELGDERDLKAAIAKAEAAHDEVESLKLKTELLRKQKEIEETTKDLDKKDDKKTRVPARRTEHVDALSASGLFQSIGAIINPNIDVSHQQLKELRDINRAVSGSKNPFKA
jgi:hypothetical protein